jgi:hypothetical protein
MTTSLPSLARTALALLLWTHAAIAWCDDAAPKPSFKLTPSWYQSSDGNDATDINLRGTLSAHSA